MKSWYRANQSQVYAWAIFLLMVLWFASGELGTAQQPAEDPSATAQRSLVPRVRVATPELKRVSQEIVINGRTEPARAVTLKAEVEGRVVELGATEGSLIRRGKLIARLDIRDRQERLDEARALLEQRQLEFAGARQLQKDNLQSEIDVARVGAQLASARALVKRIELEIRNTRILAPFDGILERLPVEVGSYLAAGTEVARLLEPDPVIFVGYVDQQERHRLVLGDKAIVHLVHGRVIEAELRYIAAEADALTRTFKVEFEMANPDGSLVSGISATATVPVRFVSAFQVSPALLALNPADRLGIKVVNPQDRVEFLPVTVVRSSAEGLWISGFPEGTRIITVGQGYVQPGDRVIAVDEADIQQPVAND